MDTSWWGLKGGWVGTQSGGGGGRGSPRAGLGRSGHPVGTRPDGEMGLTLGQTGPAPRQTGPAPSGRERRVGVGGRGAVHPALPWPDRECHQAAGLLEPREQTHEGGRAQGQERADRSMISLIQLLSGAAAVRTRGPHIVADPWEETKP